MRLWTIHPMYLDSSGLLALWREGLLAQKVLAGNTKGYKNHPQLARFKVQENPIAFIGYYLYKVYEEAGKRYYKFDITKIIEHSFPGKISETKGQIQYEWNHYRKKIRERDPLLFKKYRNVIVPDAHPLFIIIPGSIQSWEKLK